MEEKERYVIEFAGQKGQGFLDTKIDRTMSLNDVCSLLNQQDKQITDLQSQLAITEKALELACEPRDDWGGREYSGTEYDNYYDYFMAQAKEMLEND